jgi:hypothetical protein
MIGDRSDRQTWSINMLHAVRVTLHHGSANHGVMNRRVPVPCLCHWTVEVIEKQGKWCIHHFDDPPQHIRDTSTCAIQLNVMKGRSQHVARSHI